MLAISSNLESPSVGSAGSGLGPHVEELHAFFKTRGVGFGSVEDLRPFMERLESDAGFREEMASMVRTIIYRERDGLSRLELIELLETAVAGPAVEDAAAPEVREAVRGMMAFVESVFRTRRNPGAVGVDGAEKVAVPELEHRAVDKESEVAAVAAESDAAEAAPVGHPTEVFYRARMVAEEEGAETFAEERAELRAEDVAVEPESALHTDLHLHIPFEDFGDREVAERGSPAWLWVAGICAMLLAFCAGLFVHQRLIVPLRDPNTPYQTPPAEAQEGPSIPQTPPAASGAQTAGTTDTIASSSETVGPGVRPSGALVPVGDVSQRPRYMAPATMGASQAVMQAHLVYAPEPAYPMMAEMTRTQGRVTVEAVVGKDGRVIRAQAISGHHLLRGAALREVYARRYRPYTVNARPVNVATMVTVDFRLRR
jgi:hypothetical protein